MHGSAEFPVDLEALASVLPLGVAVVRLDGTVRAINDRICEILGRAPDEVLGRSVLDHVHPDDVEFIADVLVDGARFVGDITGPLHARYVRADGAVRGARVWSRPCFDMPGVEGYVITISEESTAILLPEAVRAIATQEPFEHVVDLIARSFAGHPCMADATVLVDRGAGPVPLGIWPFHEVDGDGDGGAGDEVLLDPAWVGLHNGGEACDLTADDLPAEVAARCRSVGIDTTWARPVWGAGGDQDLRARATLLVWRTAPGAPSLNQQRSLTDAADVLRIALDHEAYRRDLERIAFVDPISGLDNRAWFEHLLDEHESRSAADTSSDVAGVLYVDLDGFKQVNDLHGHDAGDQVLLHAASRLRSTVRGRDDIVRVGGDEFVVLCRPPASEAGVESVAARVIESLARPFTLPGGETVTIGASVGVEWGCLHVTLRQRVELADRAMLEAKRGGKGGWRRAAGDIDVDGDPTTV